MSVIVNIESCECGGSSSGSGVILSRTVTLTDAQIKALPTTPIEIIPAPGANKFLYPLGVVWYLKWNANYTNINSLAFMNIGFPDGSGSIMYLDESAPDALSKVSSLLAHGKSMFAQAGQQGMVNGTFVEGAIINGGNVNAVINQHFETFFDNGGGSDLTGGDPANTLQITVLYTVIDV